MSKRVLQQPHYVYEATTVPKDMRAKIVRLEAELREARELLKESIEPGVFGEWGSYEDPLLDACGLRSCCERYGYGAVLHHVAALWALKRPDSAHTVAACVSVRRAYIAQVEALLGRDTAASAAKAVPEPMRWITNERRRQDEKWGEQNHSDPEWMAILVEEVGEAAQCVCKSVIGEPGADADGYYLQLPEELVQVAAVCVAWIECIHRRDAASAAGGGG